ncbi:MAG: sigma-70 family RNA polymerase sigma factor, partial [SAR324 cluster bacterium]|nr:sigma-70 family RNA polymerase sigma factor [SAR324 cluster bacterium]
MLHEYLQGEPGSFELLVRRHTPELFRFTLRLTGSSVAAEDAVQDTFLQVHISAESFDLSRRFKPWLFTIAANKSRGENFSDRTPHHRFPTAEARKLKLTAPTAAVVPTP